MVEPLDKKRKVDPVKVEPPAESKSAKPSQWQFLIEEAEKFVKAELAQNDGSHDWAHIDRVRNLALVLAEEERIESSDVVELAALLHDIRDWKYSGSASAGEEAARSFLLAHNYPPEKVDLVCSIVKNLGFKSELGGGVELFPELAVVQDADRLDAIGAIGIARTFTYGGSRKSALWHPEDPLIKAKISQKDYVSSERRSSTIAHFYEKLLHLRDMMKTSAGKRRAEARHKYMEEFLQKFFDEWAGKA